MAITANADGIVSGKFVIPANVAAGLKEVAFRGSGGSFGDASFLGQGSWTETVLREVTNVTRNYYDPLAQTFILEAQRQIGAVDIYVKTKGTTPLTVQLRETSVGFPTQVVVAEATLRPGQITAGAWNRFAFETPVSIPQNLEHAIVVLCNDAVTEVGVSQLGKWDLTSNQWVTSQPFGVGILLSSANASTWTAHQDMRLTFRLLAARYTQTQRAISLGSVTLSGATDLIVLGLTESAASGADADIVLTIPGVGAYTVSDQQSIRLSGPVSGAATLQARLRATGTLSAVAAAGTQIIAGALSTSANYVSRAFDADAAGSTIRVRYEALVPSGAAVTPTICGVDAGDTWLAMTQERAPKPLGNGVHEFYWWRENVQEAALRVRLVLTGSASARPVVANLRASVT